MGLFFLHTSPPPLTPYPSPSSAEAEMMGERRLQDAPQNVADESDASWSTQPVGGRVGGDGEENQKLEEP